MFCDGNDIATGYLCKVSWTGVSRHTSATVSLWLFASSRSTWSEPDVSGA